MAGKFCPMQILFSITYEENNESFHFGLQEWHLKKGLVVRPAFVGGLKSFSGEEKHLNEERRNTKTLLKVWSFLCYTSTLHHLLDTPHSPLCPAEYIHDLVQNPFLHLFCLSITACLLCSLIHTHSHCCCCCCQRGTNSFINIFLASFWSQRDYKAVDAVFFHCNKHNTLINDWSLMQTESFKLNQALINTVISQQPLDNKVVLVQI